MKDVFKKLIDSGKKILAVWIIFHSTIWIYLSYYLAFMGKDDIAESLSGKVVTDVIVVFTTYALSTTVGNVFRYNQLGGKSTYKDDIERDC